MAWSKSEQSRVLKSSSNFGDGSVYRDKCIPLRLLPNKLAAHPSGVPKKLIALGVIPQNSTDGPFWGTNETHITTHAVSDLLFHLGSQIAGGEADGSREERSGGQMLLDVQDQEIVDKLPRLSELHEAYGVQVNSIPVSELFDLYERTGFLYPDKAARLTPHIEKVRENWRRMLRGGESLLY